MAGTQESNWNEEMDTSSRNNDGDRYVIWMWLNTNDSSLADQIQIVNGMGGGIRGGQIKDDTSSPTSSTTDNTTTAN